MKPIRSGVATAFAVLLAGLASAAPRTWDGGGTDRSWGTAQNWDGDAALPTPHDDVVYWNNNGLGTNVLDQNRTVRYMRYTNSSASDLHLTDMAGHTLTVEKDFWLGPVSDPNLDNSQAVISNGTVVLGSATYVGDLLVGYRSVAADKAVSTNHSLTVYGTLNLTSAGNIYAGHYSRNHFATFEGELDLSGCQIVSPCGPDTITCANLVVGEGGGRDVIARGGLRLPPTVRAIAVDTFVIGGKSRYGNAMLDFGAGSQLTGITARTKFAVGDGTAAIVTNWPMAVDLTLGVPGAPATFSIAGLGVAGRAELTFSNAAVRGYIGNLWVGSSVSEYNGGSSCRGVLDMARAEIHSGGESNALRCTQLRVAGGALANGSYNLQGTLRLPPALTRIETGLFELGVGGVGILDFGPDSQLDSFIVTNTFSYGCCSGGKASFVNTPTNGMALAIGQGGAPVSELNIGRIAGRQTVSAGNADLILTNVAFSADVRNVFIGAALTSHADYWGAVGTLDLRESELLRFEVGDSLWIGRGPAAARAKTGVGRMYLPAGTVNIATNLLLGDTMSPSLGLLDLHGTRVTVGGTADLYPTATVKSRVMGVSAGLDLTWDSASSLSVSNGAVIQISFDADPVNPNQEACWGLRLAGNRTNAVDVLQRDGKLIWTTEGLSVVNKARVGIHYDERENVTYVGLPRKIAGTLLILR